VSGNPPGVGTLEGGNAPGTPACALDIASTNPMNTCGSFFIILKSSTFCTIAQVF
jgi:hypothetical protein